MSHKVGLRFGQDFGEVAVDTEFCGQALGGRGVVARDDNRRDAALVQHCDDLLRFGADGGLEFNSAGQFIVHGHEDKRIALGVALMLMGRNRRRHWNFFHLHKARTTHAHGTPFDLNLEAVPDFVMGLLQPREFEAAVASGL